MRVFNPGSVLGPLLFNGVIDNIFMFVKKSEIFKLADDKILYDCGLNIPRFLENPKPSWQLLKKGLEKTFSKISQVNFNWRNGSCLN